MLPKMTALESSPPLVCNVLPIPMLRSVSGVDMVPNLVKEHLADESCPNEPQSKGPSRCVRQGLVHNTSITAGSERVA